ncbi:MAG: hypothetical protein LC104_15440 [Bacteroidales bacterium]|nr:hypothetical protein [Bacteroidales bacterium]
MDRRYFIQQGLGTGALALGAGGFLFIRRSQARETIVSNMLDDALPPLTASGIRGLNTLPGRAREQIKRYFHGKCLNVSGFVNHICSNNFTERLGRCHTPDEKEACFLQAFCSRVVTEAEILHWVETIAAEIGSELDDEWTTYCAEMSLKWNTRIRGYGEPLVADQLTNRLSEVIRTDLSQAAHMAMTTDQRPAVGETIGKIGKSAVLLLPLVRFGSVGMGVGIPTFMILAAKHVWDYMMSRLNDCRGDYQMAISSRLALLGNRVGAEFEREVRQRITDLQIWQERSIRATATQLAEERVTLI